MNKKETELINFAKRLFIASQLLKVDHDILEKNPRYIRIDIVLTAKNKSDVDFHSVFSAPYDFEEAVFEFSRRCLNYAPDSTPSNIKFVCLNEYWEEI